MDLQNALYRLLLLVIIAGAPFTSSLRASGGVSQILNDTPSVLGDINYGPIPEENEEGGSEQS